MVSINNDIAESEYSTYPSEQIIYSGQNSNTEEFENQIDFVFKSYKFNLKKPEASVFDVAAFILKKLGPLTTMKLHKLLYYSQAWSLVWDEQTLFPERIEAWANGPVVPEFFKFHKGLFIINNISIGNPDCLNEKQKETVQAVLDFYGDKSAQWLIELTHIEDPWKNARLGLAPNERGNREIKLDEMANYYSSL